MIQLKPNILIGVLRKLLRENILLIFVLDFKNKIQFGQKYKPIMNILHLKTLELVDSDISTSTTLTNL